MAFSVPIQNRFFFFLALTWTKNFKKSLLLPYCLSVTQFHSSSHPNFQSNDNVEVLCTQWNKIYIIKLSLVCAIDF